MNPELNWLSNCVTDSRSSAKRAQFDLDSLQEFRREVAGVWNDSFSTEMSRRYFDPLAEDAAISVSELSCQIECLEKCVISLDQTTTAIISADEASVKIEQSISEAAGIFRGIDIVFGTSVDEASRATSHANNALDLISQANATGS